MLPSHKVLFMVVHQLDYLGLSKKSLKSLLSKTKKALSDDEKVKVINKLNADALAMWRKFLKSSEGEGMGKTGAVLPTIPVLSKYLLTILLFQIHAHKLSRVSVKSLLEKARKGRGPTTGLAITEALNKISDSVYKNYRVKFSLADAEEKQEKLRARQPSLVVESPTKSRAKKVVHKIVVEQRKKTEDLKVVESAIAQTPVQEPTLQMLRARAEALKVDISDLGRKKREIVKRLEMAEAGVLPAQVPVIPLAVEAEASLAPEPERKPMNMRSRSFVNKTKEQLRSEFPSFYYEGIEEDLNRGLVKKYPSLASDEMKVSVSKGRDGLKVTLPSGRVLYSAGVSSPDLESELRAIFNRLGSEQVSEGRTSIDEVVLGFDLSDTLIERYLALGTIEEDLARLPIPSSPAELAVMRTNLEVVINQILEKTSLRRGAEPYEGLMKLLKWVDDMKANVMGTTSDQNAKAFVEYLSAIDPNYRAVCFANTKVSYYAQDRQITTSLVLFHTNEKYLHINDNDILALIPESKKQYPDGKANFMYHQRIDEVLENVHTNMKGSFDPSKYKVEIASAYFGEEDPVKVEVRVAHFANKTISPSFVVLPRLTEALDIVKKTFTSAGFTVSSPNPAPLGQAVRGVKQLIDAANQKDSIVAANKGRPITLSDVYPSEAYYNTYVIATPRG